MNKQTAVEWLIDQVEDFIGLIPIDIIAQAKAMEREQIEEAYWEGGQDVPVHGRQCKQYYNETYTND